MSTQIIMYYIALDGLQGPGIQLLWASKKIEEAYVRTLRKVYFS